MASKPRRPHSTGRLGQGEGAPRLQCQLTSISQCSLGNSIKDKFRKALADIKQTANGILASLGSSPGSSDKEVGKSSKCENKLEKPKRKVVPKSPPIKKGLSGPKRKEEKGTIRTFGAFECVVCRKFFRQKETLEKHYRLHRGDRPYRCNRCWNSCSWMATIARSPVPPYWRSVPPTLTKPVRSPNADAKYGRSRSLPPVAVVTSACCWAFGSGSGISTRGVSKQPTRQTGDTLAGAARKATTTGHGTPVKRPAAMENVSVSESAAASIWPYDCYMCGKKYELIDKLNTHIKEDHIKPIQCIICGKLFEKRSNFVAHMHRHPRDRLYRCDVCATSWNLYEHLKPAPLRAPGRPSPRPVPRPVPPNKKASSVKKSG